MSTVASLITALDAIASADAVPGVARFYRGGDPETYAMGVPIGKVFPISKAHIDLSLSDIETLLDDPRYEVRMAAVAVMDFKARRKKLPDEDRRALFDLYLRRHDRIDNWDLVDRAAPFVVGEYLVNGDRTVLDRLAASANPNERRTALVATYAFLKRSQVKDTFRIADILAPDSDAYVQKAIASWVREAGKRDQDALVAFLDRHRDVLPRPTRSAASKLLPPDIRAGLLS